MIKQPGLNCFSRNYKVGNHIVVPSRAETEPELSHFGEAADIVGKSGGTLQIIVKLANIHLSPDKPDYEVERGIWKVRRTRISALV